MSKVINRTLMLVEAQNVIGWFNEFSKNKINELPVKVQWNILSGIKKLRPVVADFEEFRNKLIQDIQTEYFGEEKSEEFDREQLDENGEPVLDADGNHVMEKARKVKDEFIDEYQNRINEVNKEINDLLMEKTTYSLNGIDLDAVVDGLADDASINLDDINFISFIDINSADKESD